jgi:hypothetical protein
MTDATEWIPWGHPETTLLMRFLRNWRGPITLDVQGIGGNVLDTPFVIAADAGVPTEMTNIALWMQEPTADAERETFEALDAFYGITEGRKTGDIMLFSPWGLPQAREFGWKLHGHPTFMVRAPGGDALPTPQGLDFVTVHDDRTHLDWEAAIAGGFEVPWPEERAPGWIYGPHHEDHPGIVRVVGYAEGKPAVATEVCIAEGINNITLVATPPWARRRGYARVATLNASLVDPTLPTLLAASTSGRPTYEGIGFLPVSPFTMYAMSRS